MIFFLIGLMGWVGMILQLIIIKLICIEVDVFYLCEDVEENENYVRVIFDMLEDYMIYIDWLE